MEGKWVWTIHGSMVDEKGCCEQTAVRTNPPDCCFYREQCGRNSLYRNLVHRQSPAVG